MVATAFSCFLETVLHQVCGGLVSVRWLLSWGPLVFCSFHYLQTAAYTMNRYNFAFLYR